MFRIRYPFFVRDGINSVADYNSLRVGVGCRMSDGCRMYVCMSRGKFHDWITFERLEILSWNFVWCLILVICLGNEPIEKIGPPQPPQPPYPPTKHMRLANFHNFHPILMKLGMEVNFGGIRIKWADGGAGSIFRPPQPPYQPPENPPIANFGNFGPILIKNGGEV